MGTKETPTYMSLSNLRCVRNIRVSVKKIQLKISLVQNNETFLLGRVRSSPLETIRIRSETFISDDFQTLLTNSEGYQCVGESYINYHNSFPFLLLRPPSSQHLLLCKRAVGIPPGVSNSSGVRKVSKPCACTSSKPREICSVPS